MKIFHLLGRGCRLRVMVLGHGLWVMGCGLWSWGTGYGLWVTGCGLGERVMGCGLRVTVLWNGLWVMGCGLRSWGTGYGLWIMGCASWTWFVDMGGLQLAPDGILTGKWKSWGTKFACAYATPLSPLTPYRIPARSPWDDRSCLSSYTIGSVILHTSPFQLQLIS